MLIGLLELYITNALFASTFVSFRAFLISTFSFNKGNFSGMCLNMLTFILQWCLVEVHKCLRTTYMCLIFNLTITIASTIFMCPYRLLAFIMIWGKKDPVPTMVTSSILKKFSSLLSRLVEWPKHYLIWHFLQEMPLSQQVSNHDYGAVVH